MRLALLEDNRSESCSVELDKDWYSYLLSVYGGSAYDKDGSTVQLNDPMGVLVGYFKERCCPTRPEGNLDFLDWKAKRAGWTLTDVMKRGLDALNTELNKTRGQ